MNKKALKGFVLLIGIFLVMGISSCNPPPPVITIGCSVSELINAIQDANTNPDHNRIVLSENCDYELGEVIFEVPAPEVIVDYESVGLPIIITPITITGNGSRIYRPDTLGTELFRIFHIDKEGSLALVDLTLEGGSVNEFGGGVFVDGGTVTFTQCTVKKNTAQLMGGGVFSQMDSSEVVLVNSEFSDNSAGDGGGIYHLDGLLDIDFESLFERNQAIHGSGGAIESFGHILNIYNSTIRDNQSGSGGGGLSLNTNEVNIQGVLIEHNQAPTGGGMYVVFGVVNINDSIIRQNQANWGGGLYIKDGEQSIKALLGVTINGTTIEENSADEFGGGVLLDYEAGASFNDCAILNNHAGLNGGGIGFGINAFEGGAEMKNCTVAGNTATHLGGGIHNNSGEFHIHNSTISGNSAEDGGGIFNDAFLHVVNTTISGNQALRGGGVYHAFEREAEFSFVTIAENTANHGGGVRDFGLEIQFTNSLLTSNTPENCIGDIIDIGVNIEDGSSCGFSINADPLIEPLADNGGHTYTHAIPVFSPAVEVADPCQALGTHLTLGEDQRGEPRPQGAGCDLGAFEAPISALFHPPVPSPCIFTAIKNSNCRESDHANSPVVEILMQGDIALLVAINPENTHGRFKLPSGQECWIVFNLLESQEPGEECDVPMENPPKPEVPEELECRRSLGENGCKESGGKWIVPLVEAPYCSCP